MRAWIARARKGLAGAAGLVAQAISLGVLHGTELRYATAILAALTALGVYVIPNDKPKVEPAP